MKRGGIFGWAGAGAGHIACFLFIAGKTKRQQKSIIIIEPIVLAKNLLRYGDVYMYKATRCDTPCPPIICQSKFRADQNE